MKVTVCLISGITFTVSNGTRWEIKDYVYSIQGLLVLSNNNETSCTVKVKGWHFQDNAEIWRYLPSDKHMQTRSFPMADIDIQNNTRYMDYQ